MDLSLASIEELQEELFNRTNACVVSYIRHIDAGNPIIMSSWSAPNGWTQAMGLCDICKIKIYDSNQEKEA